MMGLHSPVMVSWRGYTIPLARPHGVGWTPPSGGRLGADTLPFSTQWLALSFVHGAVLAYSQRPHTPCPVTRHRAPHAGRSGGGSRRHEHDTSRSSEGDTCMAQTPSSPHTQKGRLRTYPLPGGWQVLVGQTDADNDYLSFRVAQPHDWWFHVRGMPGSHVILQGPPGVLSQITENRKVDPHKPLIFQYTIFRFCPQKATLRQSRRASASRAPSRRA